MVEITQITGINAESILKCFDQLTAKLEAVEQKLSKNQSEKSDYLTRNEVKNLLHVSFPTIHNWTNKGIIQPYHVGKKVYFKRSEIEAVLNSKKGA